MARKHRSDEAIQSKRAIRGGVPAVDATKPDTFPYSDCGEYTDSLTLTDQFAIALAVSVPATGNNEQHQEAGHVDEVPDGSTRRNK